LTEVCIHLNSSKFRAITFSLYELTTFFSLHLSSTCELDKVLE
ncbi:unnamed protein product, partial [Larinioides sclopetarius]